MIKLARSCEWWNPDSFHQTPADEYVIWKGIHEHEFCLEPTTFKLSMTRGDGRSNQTNEGK